MKKIIFLFFILTIISSCSLRVEKKRYSKGFHVEFSSNKTAKLKKLNKKTIDTVAYIEKQPYIKKVEPALKNHLALLDSFKKNTNEEYEIYVSTKEITPKINLTKQNQAHTDFRKCKKSKSTIKSKKSRKKNSLLYLFAGLMGITVFGIYRKNKKRVLKVTKWASNNKIKARGLIALSQTGLAILGVFSGKELYHIGYTFSNNLEYVFGGIMLLGFLSFLNRKNKEKSFDLKGFLRKKLGHLAIGISFFILTLGIGNRISANKNQVSPLGYAIEKIDKNHFSKKNIIPEKTNNDTIITKDNKTIICKIAFVNNDNIFYQYNPKKKKVVKTHISRSKVKYFSVEDKNVIINGTKEINSKNQKGTANVTHDYSAGDEVLMSLYIFLTIILLIALLLGSLVLSCVLACQGNTVLAIGTLIVGGVLSWLLIKLMIKLIKKHNLKKAND